MFRISALGGNCFYVVDKYIAYTYLSLPVGLSGRCWAFAVVAREFRAVVKERLAGARWAPIVGRKSAMAHDSVVPGANQRFQKNREGGKTKVTRCQVSRVIGWGWQHPVGV